MFCCSDTSWRVIKDVGEEGLSCARAREWAITPALSFMLLFDTLGRRSGRDLSCVNARERAICASEDTGATLDNLRKIVETLEKHTVPTARHVMGRAHPVTQKIEDDLRRSRAALRAHETQPPQQA